MNILDLTSDNHRAIKETAAVLLESFRDVGAYVGTTLDDAVAEVEDSLEAGRMSRIAVDGKGAVCGWIGGIEEYDGNVWELHPLVVRRDTQGKGVGRSLVLDFEQQVAARGAWTITLGADDENARTTLGGIDLYPDVLGNLRNIQNLRRHPFEFYLKLGYHIVGTIPDANGFGKPDILMAKRIRQNHASITV